MSERVLPEGWIKLPFLETCQQVSVTGKKLKASAYQDDGQYRVVDQGQEAVSGFSDNEAMVVDVDAPVIVFGDHTRIVKWVPWSFVPGADGIKVLSPFEGLYPRFFYYQLSAIELPDKGYSRHFKFLKECDVLLPPLSEQKVIADKLDELLAQANNLKSRLEAIPAILKRFRQSVLAAAVSGDLYSFDDAEYWQDASIGDLASLVTSGSRGWSKYYASCGDIFVRAQNIKNDILDLEDVAYVVLPEKAEGTRTKIEDGDFLITITGANVTKCASVSGNIGAAFVSQHVGLVRWKDRSVAPYLELFLKAESHGRKQLLDMAYGGGKPGLNLKNIRDVSLRLPSVEEQKEIVRRVDQFFAFADQIEQQVKNAQTCVNKLTQSILAKAFRGELTAEWRAANPELISGELSARALLERIKAEKAKQKPAGKGRGRKPRQASVTV
ncbi:specificity determinant for hsdM and hsdR [Halomonas campisalis]|uniref:Specificity determinant for hsdM and hsdR n=1 Tax=Billgrantia campisalis TaxID=74661 RepID=A0ABS9PD02_9GAMM|nr:restriction endonuclease subunit S [Halomonas campisalis]MCG6659339.1 specificity determinant for hsdM and hsdR [Halomonas campisalis]MDR5863941.1 restriction endonuclease subunit S [Halomonas campisalis]